MKASLLLKDTDKFLLNKHGSTYTFESRSTLLMYFTWLVSYKYGSTAMYMSSIRCK